MVLKFDYLNKDTICTSVEADSDTGEVKVVDYTDFIYHTVFGKRPHTIEELNDFFESRCFPEGRADRKDLLTGLGLSQYNPLDIVRKTHGVQYSDWSWIRFEGEALKWDDVKWEYCKQEKDTC